MLEEVNVGTGRETESKLIESKAIVGFQPVVVDEVELMRKICERRSFHSFPNLPRRAFLRTGNYTVCLFSPGPPFGTIICVGISKRNPTDVENKKLGEVLALRRAVLDWIELLTAEEVDEIETGTGLMMERSRK